MRLPNHSLQATATRLRCSAWSMRKGFQLPCGSRRLGRVAVPEFKRSTMKHDVDMSASHHGGVRPKGSFDHGFHGWHGWDRTGARTSWHPCDPCDPWSTSLHGTPQNMRSSNQPHEPTETSSCRGSIIKGASRVPSCLRGSAHRSAMRLFAIWAWCALALIGLPSCSERASHSSVNTDSLTLTPVVFGEEPFVVAYTIPFDIDVSSNLWSLGLLDNGKPAIAYEISRQTNGTYLVQWSTLFATHGLHELQVALHRPRKRTVLGPGRMENVTNLVSFDPYQTSFGSRIWIRGTSAIPAAQYRIEFYDASNTPLATIEGHTENGIIDEVWPCTTPDGGVRNDHRFRADFFITPSHSLAHGAPTGPLRYPLSFVRIGPDPERER
jgi:hypothetical protein